MLTTLDKAWVALIASGGLTQLLPLLGGPFANSAFNTGVVAVITGILTWLVPNQDGLK